MVHRILADVLFVLHAMLVLIVLFGWVSPRLWYPYMAALVIGLVSDLFFGYCVLSKWEFDLRRKIDPKIDYNYCWTSYYTHRFTRRYISDVFFSRASVVFLVSSIAINLFFH